MGHDTEYVFDFDRMLALSGNTGPYVQYAAARIRSILRKAEAAALPAGEPGEAVGEPTAAVSIAVVEPAERALALHLLEYGATLRRVGELLEPHRLCAYLFELSQLFTSFYDQCPVLKADESVRQSRLALCALVLHRLSEGLDLLGIETPENM
ncbi:Arginine--tRNA ligase [compost metagenome]